MSETATLLVSCPDQKGLVSGISSFISRHGGNILQSDQYTDIEAGVFLARFEFHLDGFQIPRDQIAGQFRPLAEQFAMKFELHFSGHIPKVALVCLAPAALPGRSSAAPAAGEFNAEMAVVVSNHPDLSTSRRVTVCRFCIFPSPRKTRSQQEAEEMREL